MQQINIFNDSRKKIIESFIHPNQKERFLALIANPKKRQKLLEHLSHNVQLDSRYATRIPANQQNAEDIEKILKLKGAGSKCFVVSENSRIDGRELNLNEALRETVGQGMGTFLSIVPGQLAYFESEDSGERYILFKAAT